MIIPGSRAFLAALLIVSYSGHATLLNDGTSTNGLTRLATSSTAVTALNPTTGGSLVASQYGLAFGLVPSAWYPAGVAVTSGVYQVSAQFTPTQTGSEYRGGVIGWLNTEAGNGIALEVIPGGSEARFRLAFVDFTAADASSLVRNHLFELDGRPATDPGSTNGWSELPPEYDASVPATFEISFSAPTNSDSVALSNVTAHIVARVLQGDTPVQVGRTMEMLTDLPLPETSQHRLGYFAVRGNIFGFPGVTYLIGALDNLEASGPLAIVNQAPLVNLTSPMAGADYAAPAIVPLAALASDPDGAVAVVQFLVGTNLVAEVTSPPYEATWAGSVPGTYSVTARAVDGEGASATTLPVQITVTSNQAPQLTLVSPTNGASFTLPASVPLTADATDSDGTIASIEFFSGTNLIATLTAPPYSTVWNVPNAGTYSVTARATDNEGGQSTSPSAQVVIVDNIPPASLSITRLPGSVRISWSASGNALQVATNLNAPNWVTVTSSGTSYTEPSNIDSISTNGLVLHLRADEGSGTEAADASPYQHRGVLTNGATWGGGRVGPFSLLFTNTNSAVRLQPSVLLDGVTNRFSLSVWVRPMTVGRGGHVIVKPIAEGSWTAPYATWALDIAVKGTNWAPRVLASQGSQYTEATSPVEFRYGEWVQIVGVFDGSRVRIYGNGFALGSEPFTGTLRATPGQPVLLGVNGAYAQEWNGFVDDLRVYSRALSLAEIQALWMATEKYYRLLR